MVDHFAKWNRDLDLLPSVIYTSRVSITSFRHQLSLSSFIHGSTHVRYLAQTTPKPFFLFFPLSSFLPVPSPALFKKVNKVSRISGFPTYVAASAIQYSTRTIPVDPELSYVRDYDPDRARLIVVAI